MSLNTYAWLRGSKYRLLFLRKLANGPLLPSELARTFNINRSSVSRTLSELQERGLVDKSKSSSRTVAYFITDEGKKLLAYANRITANRNGGG